jgi:putative FmdB family regulatory protein
MATYVYETIPKNAKQKPRRFEVEQKMSDPPVSVCPKCKAKKVERLISRTSFQLKGGGWYGDLYASSKPGSSKGADKASSAESSTSSSDATTPSSAASSGDGGGSGTGGSKGSKKGKKSKAA